MALFGFGKKKEEKAPTCACNEPAEAAAKEEPGCCCNAPVEEAATSCCCGGSKEPCCEGADKGVCCVKVLGSGCRSCHAQLENTQAAVKSLGLGVEVEYVTDLQKIMEMGVMSMPGLVINDQVVSIGKVLKPAEVEKLLHKFGA